MDSLAITLTNTGAPSGGQLVLTECDGTTITALSFVENDISTHTLCMPEQGIVNCTAGSMSSFFFHQGEQKTPSTPCPTFQKMCDEGDSSGDDEPADDGAQGPTPAALAPTPAPTEAPTPVPAAAPTVVPTPAPAMGEPEDPVTAPAPTGAPTLGPEDDDDDDDDDD